MRFSDLTEDAPSKNIRDMIMTTALSLVATGREEVKLQSLISEIKKRTNIDVPYNVMVDILNSLPFVTDVNSDIVTFGGEGDTSTDEPEESSEEIVSDMATKAASSNLKQ
jgi:hypothetical protein